MGPSYMGPNFLKEITKISLELLLLLLLLLLHVFITKFDRAASRSHEVRG